MPVIDAVSAISARRSIRKFEQKQLPAGFLADMVGLAFCAARPKKTLQRDFIGAIISRLTCAGSSVG